MFDWFNRAPPIPGVPLDGDGAAYVSLAIRVCVGVAKENRDEYEARIAELEQRLAEAGQWVPVPDGIYSADEGTTWESRWEVIGDGVEITDIVGDYVSVSIPDGWKLMRQRPTEEAQT
jgi:hypothetical protein